MEISSKNLAKFSSGNILKKSRTKQLTQNTKLTKNHNNIKSQNCLGLTQKLKKK